MVKCGIVGLPNVGKSTLFNALLKKSAFDKSSAGQASGAKTGNYPFTTIEPNVGVVDVPDDRLEKLKEVVEKSEGLSPGFKIIRAVVQFVDIAGLVKGAHKGEGLGNQFLSHIREVDAIVFVVRDFKNEDIVKTGENPQEDLEVLKSELLLKDLETLEKRIDSLGRETKALSPNDPKRLILPVLEKAKSEVEKGNWLADVLSDEELEKIRETSLLSAKKYIVVINSDESSFATSDAEALEVKKASEDKGDLGKGIENAIRISAKMDPTSLKLRGVKEESSMLRISAKMEEELASLSEDEQKEYLKEVGLDESGLERLIKRAYEVLRLETFLTAGSKEIRAWTIKRGSLAQQAAGVIHTDFERGFIAADVVPFDKFVEAGGWQAARAKGIVKTIGKNDVMPKNVVVEFKFSV